jgi:hypothetical protein
MGGEVGGDGHPAGSWYSVCVAMGSRFCLRWMGMAVGVIGLVLSFGFGRSRSGSANELNAAPKLISDVSWDSLDAIEFRSLIGGSDAADGIDVDDDP